MLNRMTRLKDRYTCRIKSEYCTAENWMEYIYEEDPFNFVDTSICDSCPFMKIINHLGELEDYIELLEDDKK